MTIRADLHVHSCASPDGRSTISSLAAAAKARGLSAIAICDHDRCTPLLEQSDVLLIPGVEITSARGHILGLFLEKEIDFAKLGKYPAPEKAIAAIHAARGLAVLAHPFAPQKLTPEEILALPLDGIETANARAMLKPGANEKARTLCKTAGLSATGGSDAHHASELGGCVTEFPCAPELAAMKAALQEGRCQSRALRACKWREKGLSKLRREKNCGTAISRCKAFFYFCGCVCRDVFHV